MIKLEYENIDDWINYKKSVCFIYPNGEIEELFKYDYNNDYEQIKEINGLTRKRMVNDLTLLSIRTKIVATIPKNDINKFSIYWYLGCTNIILYFHSFENNEYKPVYFFSPDKSNITIEQINSIDRLNSINQYSVENLAPIIKEFYKGKLLVKK